MNFVAVHCGAGYHSESNRPELSALCKNACNSTVKHCETQGLQTHNNNTALEMAVNAVTVIEDCPLTNAGIGSNLNRDGWVQCDAGVMESQSGHFAGVAAVSKVKNPANLCRHMIYDQNNSTSQKLISPSLLVGAGAELYASEKGVLTISNKSLVTEKAIKDLHSAKQFITTSASDTPNKRLDTVGAISITSNGDCAAACSSGGIILKHSGRVGHAPVFGCGCFAWKDGDHSIAVSVSGCGEYIIRTQFAQKCAEYLLQKAEASEEETLPIRLQKFFHDNFLMNKYLHGSLEAHKIAGAIILLHTKDSNLLEFAWIHNSPTMCVGYSQPGRSTTKSVISTYSHNIYESHVNSLGLKFG